MRLGLTTGYSGPRMDKTMDLILEAERLGYDSVWSGEAWGSTSSPCFHGSAPAPLRSSSAVASCKCTPARPR